MNRMCRSCAYAGALLVVLVLIIGPSAHGETPSQASLAEVILKRADEVRFPSRAFMVQVRIQTFEDGKPTEERLLRVLSKGSDKTLVMTLAPASERGQILLMRDRDLWVYFPRVSQPVRLPLAERFVGQISNGDIARANFTGEYTPQLAGVEQTGGDEFYVLDLHGINSGVTYQRVRYWVRKSNFWPYKAEFYSLSNRLLKTCRYEGYRELGGTVRPTKLVMTDALRPSEESILEYSGMEFRDLPDNTFTKGYLNRLE